MHQQLVLFLGGDFYSDLDRIEYYLPINLSNYFKVTCFEYPQFLKIFKILVRRLKYIEKFHNLTIIHSFGLLPFGRSLPIIDRINHLLNYYLTKLLLKENFTNPILISLTPELVYITWQLVKFRQVIYYVIDEYTSLPAWSNILQKNHFRSIEKKFIKMADKIIVVSPALKEKYSSIHKRVYYFPTPANLVPFRRKQTRRIPPDIRKIPKPIVGFMGALFDWKIDIKLLLKALDFLPNVSFVFIGSFKIENKQLLNKLESKQNFYYLGHKTVADLPNYVKCFDVCIIPYKTNSYGLSAYPVKINEYLILGKPVVTTALPALKDLGNRNLIYWVSSKNIFINSIENALNESNRPQLINKRIQYALNHSWENKISQLTNFIDD